MIFWRKLAFQVARKGEPGRALRLAATRQLPVGHNCHPLRFPERRPFVRLTLPLPVVTPARDLNDCPCARPRGQGHLDGGRQVTRGRACRSSPRDVENHAMPKQHRLTLPVSDF